MTTPELINELKQIAAGSEWDFPVIWSARIEEAATRLAELEAIVAKLPTTADGVPIVPGMRLFPLIPATYDELGYDRPDMAEPDHAVARIIGVDRHNEKLLYSASEVRGFYSTIEAASAAAAALAARGAK